MVAGLLVLAMLFWGGPVVCCARADFADPDDGQFVHLEKVRSVAGLITHRRWLRSVMEALDGVAHNGISLSRSLQLLPDL